MLEILCNLGNSFERLQVSRPYKKPYRGGTPLEHIIIDGWNRGFHILQTYNECHVMGHSVDIEYIQEQWNYLDANWVQGQL